MIRSFFDRELDGVCSKALFHLCLAHFAAEFEASGASGSGMESCPQPIAPRNGRVEPVSQTVWMPGDVVQYICDEDFTLEGDQFRVCENNGTFNGTAPECVGREDIIASFWDEFLQVFFIIFVDKCF